MNQRGFVLPAFFLSPTGIMAAVIVALSLSNALFYKLWQGKVDDYAQLQAQISLERQQAKDDAERAKERADRTTADVSLAWDRSLNAVRNDYVSRLRNSSCSSVGVRPVPNTTAKPDEATADSGLGATSFEAECRRLESDCAETTGQLMWLQEWIVRQSEVGK